MLHLHLQIFIEGTVMLKNNTAYFLAISVNWPCKIDKYE